MPITTTTIQLLGRVIVVICQIALESWNVRHDTVSYHKSHVKGAVNVPYGELENGYAFPKEKMIVFYCDRGGASMAAAREFVRRGYKTRSVIGGFAAYRGRNLVISR